MLHIYIYIYIYTQQVYYVMNKFVWLCLMRDTLLRDTTAIIGPDETCSWCDKFILLQRLNRQVKIYTIYICDTYSAQIFHFGTWCMWCARSFFIVYKSLLAKFIQDFLCWENEGVPPRTTNLLIHPVPTKFLFAPTKSQ